MALYTLKIKLLKHLNTHTSVKIYTRSRARRKFINISGGGGGLIMRLLMNS